MPAATEQRPDDLNAWQKKALGVPEDLDVCMGGGRGGGKTRQLLTFFLRHTEQHKGQARCLVVRKSFPGLMDLEAEAKEFFYSVYGNTYKFDGQKHRFTLPNGGTVQLDQLETEKDFQKYQGKSFSHIAVDEAGQYASPALVDRLRSSLRAPLGVPTRFFILANPGGAGHHWLVNRHMLKQQWIPYADPATGQDFVTIHSTYRDNKFIDREKYAKNLLASCSTDPELGRAWLNGDWSILRGAYFSSVIDESRIMFEPWATLPAQLDLKRAQNHIAHHWGNYREYEWRYYLAHDFGVSAPSVTYAVAESPGAEHEGTFFPKGSIILFDEYASCHPDDNSKGLGLTVPDLSDQILSMCNYWKIKAQGVADDAIFNATGSEKGSIAEEFARSGVHFRRAKKGGRIARWQVMRRLLQDAGKPDVPGLYVSRRCKQWWETVPSLPRDPRRPEDVDTTAADHAADACSYGITHNPTPQTIKVKGL